LARGLVGGEAGRGTWEASHKLIAAVHISDVRLHLCVYVYVYVCASL